MINVYCYQLPKKFEVKNLPKNILSHCLKYKNPNSQKISLWMWFRLIEILNNDFKLKKIYFSFSKNGKPFLKHSNIKFSLSHSHDLIVIAISDKNIGIDIQKVLNFKETDKLAKRLLNDKQLSQYTSSKNKPLWFAKYWTKFEAYIKFNDKKITDIFNNKINIKNKKIIFKKICLSKNNSYVISVVN